MSETIKDQSIETILAELASRVSSLESGSLFSKIPFKAPKMTTTERDALDAVNGDLIYNTTTNRFEGYENGSWVDL